MVVLEKGRLIPIKDYSQNNRYQAPAGTQQTSSNKTAMFCVVPSRDMGNRTCITHVQLDTDSIASEHGTICATAAYYHWASKGYHFRQENIPIDEFGEWTTHF